MASDADFASVGLLLHGDGTNGSTTITDNGPGIRTVSVVGNAAISTTQSKFGGASIALDGTGDYLTVPWDAAFSIEASDFTVEMWVYRAASGVSHYIMSGRPAAVSNGWEWRINATNFLQFFHTGGSSITGAVAVPSGQWAHVAVVRSGTTLSMYIDGVAAGSGTVTSGTASTATTLKIGCDNTGTTGFNGWIDEIRFTKGVVRYASAFTPPSAAFANGVGEIQGVIYDDAGAPCARTVRAYRRDTGALVGSTTSDAGTGVYLISTPSLDEVQRVVLDDSGGTLYNDLIDRVIPA